MEEFSGDETAAIVIAIYTISNPELIEQFYDCRESMHSKKTE